MKRLLLTILFAGLALAGVAQTTLTTSYASQYLFRGARVAGASIQPSLDYTNGGANLGVWASAPLHGGDREADIYGSYTFGEGLTFAPGFTAYTYRDSRNTFEPSLAVGYSVSDVKLSAKGFYDLTLRVPTGEVSAAYTVGSFDLTLTGGTYRVDHEWNRYWLVGLGRAFEITKASKLTIGVAYGRGDQARTVITAGYGWTF